ncbi:MAG: DUF1018 domain-containing protein [Anaerolineae bacterium]|nr:DUF1018 domain-containing protein [Phycisphaerae bacterium]
MPTPLQLRMIHIASRQVGLNDRQYRMVLQSIAQVDSAKYLDNVQIEDVMAVFEEKGFRQKGQPEDYWRQKVTQRGRFANARMVHKIESLGRSVRYCVPAMCERFSKGRAQTPGQLTPHEAYGLIEALKDIYQREQLPDRQERDAAADEADFIAAQQAKKTDVKDDARGLFNTSA